MKRTILAGLLALPALAFAGPDATKWRSDNELRIRETAMESGFNCNAGDASSLLVGAAVIGLVARRRK